jgi:hypothetical protein
VALETAMIYFGIDDTDTIDTAGTNQLAKEIVRRLAHHCNCVSIVRHQLLFDSRVPYTSKNGSASICVQPIGNATLGTLLELVRHTIEEWYVEGSDPGLAACEHIPPAVTEYGRRCKVELIDQREPCELAKRHGIYLEGLGGTDDGVIGALAALGLIATQNDGRVVQWGTWPDDLTGVTQLSSISARGVIVRQLEGADVDEGPVDVGKHLRPNLVDGECVLWVAPHPEPNLAPWLAIKRV